MGLDARVYVNIENLRKDPRFFDALVDEPTGEVYFADEKKGLTSHLLVADEKRLGNAAEVGALRQETMKHLSENSILLKLVLYSATHSGDTIKVEDLNSLSNEIDFLEKSSAQNASPELVEFVIKLRSLIRNAQAQPNPIVFT